MTNVVQHPAAVSALKSAASRWLQMRRDHAETARRLWCGQMVSYFSDQELAVLKRGGYLSESDCTLLRQAGRKVQ